GSEPAVCTRREKGSSIALLSVGILVPRKGHELLVAALSSLEDLPWRLTIVGDRTRDAQAAARLDADILRHGLASRITIESAVPEEHLAELYRAADVFVLASLYEGYGMAFAQAIAYGVPVIGTTAGAIPETVPAGSGLLVPPGDSSALAAALRLVISDEAERARPAAHARAAAGPAPPRRAGAPGLPPGDRGQTMNEFSADWLTLREQHDASARDGAVLGALAAAFAGRNAIRVVDLGCGTGSTLRAVTRHLPARQHWLLIDNDLGLLDRASRLEPHEGVTIGPKAVDLVRDLEAALDGPVDLVTASALFDLVSAEWLERFVVEAAARRLPVYAALTHDDNIALDPADALDGRI